MNENFYIENLGERGLWIVVLSSENTSVYWSEIEALVTRNHWVNLDVHFDFLYRNGFKNRFFKTRINAQSKIICRLERYTCEHAIVTDRFFSHNIQLLEGSALSALQRSMYINQIKSR